MAEKLDPKGSSASGNSSHTRSFGRRPLSNLLDRKGIITKSELLEEMKRVKANPAEKRKEGKDEQDNQRKGSQLP